MMMTMKYDCIYNSKFENEIYIMPLSEKIILNKEIRDKEICLNEKVFNDCNHKYLLKLILGKDGKFSHIVVKKIGTIREYKKRKIENIKVYEELKDVEVNIIGDYILSLLN